MAIVAKKIPKEQVTNQDVLALVAERQGHEAAIGENYYTIYPLPAEEYASLMTVFRTIWYQLMGDKDIEFVEAISAAKALAQNMGEIDDTDVQSSVQDLIGKLTESKNVHPLEFITHDKFSTEIKTVINKITLGCDQEDLDNLTIQQTARLLEICLIQNFVPFIRLANAASRIFRGGSK